MMSPSLLQAFIEIIGAANVLSDKPAKAPYLIEQRGLFQSACLAVIRPANTQEVSQCVKLCGEHVISIVPIGGNTGLCGGAVSREGQIILSLERLNNIREVDSKNQSITVEAGCILEHVQDAAAQQDRLFPLSLGAQGSCQIGGNLSTNAGGVNVLRYGNARDLCLGIEAVLPNGSIFSDLSPLRKDNTGYSLKHLLIGAEGTLGVITAATLKLFPAPKENLTALIALPDIDAVVALYNLMREASSDRITMFELIPRIAIELTAKHFPEQANRFDALHPWCVLLVIQSTRAAPTLQDEFMQALEGAYESGWVLDALIAQNIAQANDFLSLREKLVAAQKREGASIKHDVSVPISRITEFIDLSAKAIKKISPNARPYPFGHIGDGNIHYNVCQPAQSEASDFMSQREDVHAAVHDIVHQLGGSFSAEHGVGLLKTHLIPHYKGEVALAAMRNIKKAIDPKNIMNPGKVIQSEVVEAD